MHQKNIRRLAKKQLKINHPYWNAMKKKEKKKLIKQIMDEVTNDYDFSQTLNVPIVELTGIEDQVVPRGIRTIEEMGRYIKNFYSDDLFGIDQRRPPFPEIVDKELQFIDDILDNPIINTLISPKGYSANHRQIQPYQLFRMDLLKVIKYPEIGLEEILGNSLELNPCSHSLIRHS